LEVKAMANPAICDVCGKVLKDTRGLAGHKYFVHGIRKPKQLPLAQEQLSFDKPKLGSSFVRLDELRKLLDEHAEDKVLSRLVRVDDLERMLQELEARLTTAFQRVFKGSEQSVVEEACRQFISQPSSKRSRSTGIRQVAQLAQEKGHGKRVSH